MKILIIYYFFYSYVSGFFGCCKKRWKTKLYQREENILSHPIDLAYFDFEDELFAQAVG